MPDERTPAAEEAEDTSVQSQADEDSQEGTPSESQDDSQIVPDGYVEEDRYKEAQAWATRAAQEAAQYRQIIDLARAGDPEAMAYLNWEAPDTEEDDDDLTSDERLAREVAEMREYLGTQEQQRQAERDEAELDEAYQKFYEDELNRLDPQGGFSDEYKDMVVNLANSILDEDNLPDLEAAHKQLQGYVEGQRSEWVSSKRNRAQAPKGASPSEQPNLDDDNERREHLARRLEESQEVA